MKMTYIAIALIIGATNQSCLADDIKDQEEMVVKNVYLPMHGFDDNDNVIATLDVVLPDPCYMLSSTKVEKNPTTHQLQVHQYAWRRTDGVCGNGDLLSESSANVDVSLGRLDAGKYAITANGQDNQKPVRDFAVDKAVSATIDNFNYARVTNVMTDDVVLGAKSVEVTLSGILNNSCDKVEEPVKVSHEKDVFVLLPVISPGGPECKDTGHKNFQVKVSLGALTPGNYLIHTRSLHGQAINRLVEVLKPAN